MTSIMGWRKATWPKTLNDKKIEVHFKLKGKTFSLINDMSVTTRSRYLKSYFTCLCSKIYINNIDISMGNL